VKTFVFALSIAMTTAALAQPRWGAEPERRHAAPPSPGPSSGARWGATPYADPQAERCANFRKELRDARRQERQAGTTTSSDQASLHRQDVLEQMQKAGC
jgi:hypothetical protein